MSGLDVKLLLEGIENVLESLRMASDPRGVASVGAYERLTRVIMDKGGYTID